VRIAIISLFLPTGLIGGVPLQVHFLANGLTRRGHKVTVFTRCPRPVDAAYDVRQVKLPLAFEHAARRLPGMQMHLAYIPQFHLETHRRWAVATAPVASQVQTVESTLAPFGFAADNYEGFDLIHAHGDSHFVRTTRPIVRTFHSSGLDLALYTDTWRRRLGMLSLYPFEVLSGLRARRRVYVSKALRSYLPFRDAQIISNGVDLTQFHPGTSRSAAPSILFVAGTMHRPKRGAELIRQFQRFVRPRLPEAELWMVCRERPVAAGVRAFGLQEGAALADLYRQAWVFCLPSLRESFGVPYVEALASGTPVVSTPNPGAQEILDGGTYGVIVPEAALGATLVELLQDAPARQSMAERGISRAAHFAIDLMVDRYERLYSETVA
jgi:glycosyltransferase involved in cell wall biosynthesis